MSVYTAGLWLYAAMIVATVIAVFAVTAPYGRHGRSGWGPLLPARWGWILMESPAVFGMLAVVVTLGPTQPLRWVFLAIWLSHYVYRTFIFPLRVRGRPMPLSIAGMGFGFNLFNAWINGTWIATMSDYPSTWLGDPRFIAGLALFAAGLFIHLRSDAILRALRAPGETGYRIPHGFLYRWVSCPNYLGETVQWIGWAVLTASPAGLLFAVYTLANLGPRALAHHRWYRERFEDYPEERKALVPFVI